jgi:hypothetical protein
VPGTAFAPTPPDVVEKMLDLVKVTKADVVFDLGCGDGRILVAAARKYGCGARGFDIDPECVRVAREAARREGSASWSASRRRTCTPPTWMEGTGPAAYAARSRRWMAAAVPHSPSVNRQDAAGLLAQRTTAGYPRPQSIEYLPRLRPCLRISLPCQFSAFLSLFFGLPGIR